MIIIYYLAQRWVEFTCLSNIGWDSWTDRFISSSLGSFQPHLSSLPQYVFLFFHSLFIYFWQHRVFAAAHGFSLAAVLGLLVAVASFAAEQWLLLLRSTGSRAWVSVVLVQGLLAPRHVGSSRTRHWTCVSCLGRQIRYHWNHQGSPVNMFWLCCMAC